jgi:hypothetical protein
MKLTARTYLILGLVAAPFLMAQSAPSGCNQDIAQALSTVHADLANMEATAGQGLATMCAFAPILQADVGAVVALSKLSTQQQANVQSAEAVIQTACTNPTATNSAALIAKVGAAIAEVEAIQGGAAK